MLTIALVVLSVAAAIFAAIWLATPEPEVPVIDRDGFPQYD